MQVIGINKCTLYLWEILCTLVWYHISQCSIVNPYLANIFNPLRTSSYTVTYQTWTNIVFFNFIFFFCMTVCVFLVPLRLLWFFRQIYPTKSLSTPTMNYTNHLSLYNAIENVSQNKYLCKALGSGISAVLIKINICARKR